MKKWVVSENKKSLTYVGSPLVESINGHITKSKDGYSAFISETLIGTYADSAQAKTAVELNVGDKLYEAGLLDKVSEGFADEISHIAKSVSDRVAIGLGSKKAEGRTQLRTVTKKLHDDWLIYIGRHNTVSEKEPSVTDLLNFFKATYPWAKVVNKDQIDTIMRAGMPSGASPASPNDTTVEVKTLFPILANFLIDKGLAQVSDQKGKFSGGAGDDDSYENADLDAAIENQEANGITVNMKTYSGILKNLGHDKKTMDNLIRKLNTNTALEPEEVDQPYHIILAFTSSIVDASTITDKRKNITASKNTIDMKEFFELINQANGLLYFEQLLTKLKPVGKLEKLEYLKKYMGNTAPALKRAYKLAKLMLNSFVSVGEEKEEKEEKEKEKK